LKPPVRLGEAVRMIAKIGGYLGRNNDPPPGCVVFESVPKCDARRPRRAGSKSLNRYINYFGEPHTRERQRGSQEKIDCVQ